MWTSKTLKALPKLVITLAAVVAIGFGASEVLAEDAATACWYDPPAQLGECISEQSCDGRCAMQPGYIPGSSYGECQYDGCCSCFL